MKLLVRIQQLSQKVSIIPDKAMCENLWKIFDKIILRTEGVCASHRGPEAMSGA